MKYFTILMSISSLVCFGKESSDFEILGNSMSSTSLIKKSSSVQGSQVSQLKSVSPRNTGNLSQIEEQESPFKEQVNKSSGSIINSQSLTNERLTKDQIETAWDRILNYMNQIKIEPTLENIRFHCPDYVVGLEDLRERPNFLRDESPLRQLGVKEIESVFLLEERKSEESHKNIKGTNEISLLSRNTSLNKAVFVNSTPSQSQFKSTSKVLLSSQELGREQIINVSQEKSFETLPSNLFATPEKNSSVSTKKSSKKVISKPIIRRFIRSEPRNLLQVVPVSDLPVRFEQPNTVDRSVQANEQSIRAFNLFEHNDETGDQYIGLENSFKGLTLPQSDFQNEEIKSNTSLIHSPINQQEMLGVQQEVSFQLESSPQKIYSLTELFEGKYSSPSKKKSAKKYTKLSDMFQ